VVDECVFGLRPWLTEGEESTIVNMAIEHRLMHAETLAYLLHQLPSAAKQPPRDARPEASQPEAPSRTVDIPAGRATLGRAADSPGFGWDNEFGQHAVEVPAFSMDTSKVTNGRFLEFVCDGGYRTRALWSDAAWTWKEELALEHPCFWRERDGQWFLRGMFAEAPLPVAAPVYVSQAEAATFARWAARSLPSEAQFHRAAFGTPQGEEREYPWGDEPPAERHGNFDAHHWDPTPVGEHPAGDSAFGVGELVGNGWEWTTSVFEPLPGFRAHPFYPGYSANFFDGRHYVLKGGSPRTAACMLRRSFRNWFQPHYPYVYAGFRLVGP
jgi:ergothioneine biosynthesis protein EgtB